MSVVWLNESTLSYATLSRCKLDQSNLTGATNEHGQMDHASFYNPQNVGKSANLSGSHSTMLPSPVVIFSYANFQGASLLGATQTAQNSTMPIFSQATTTMLPHSGASLSYSSFFRLPDSTVSIWRTATSSMVSLMTSLLLGTNFTNANMPGANFKTVNLKVYCLPELSFRM